MTAAILARDSAVIFERAVLGRLRQQARDVQHVLTALLAPIELRVAAECWVQGGFSREVSTRGGGCAEVPRWGSRCLIVSATAEMQALAMEMLAQRVHGRVVQDGLLAGAEARIEVPDDLPPPPRRVFSPDVLALTIESGVGGTVVATLPGRSMMLCRSLADAPRFLAFALAGCVHELQGYEVALPRLVVAATRPLASAMIDAVRRAPEGMPALPQGVRIEVMDLDTGSVDLTATAVLAQAMTDAASREASLRRSPRRAA